VKIHDHLGFSAKHGKKFVLYLDECGKSKQLFETLPYDSYLFIKAC
jgi:hypothetical protein